MQRLRTGEVVLALCALAVGLVALGIPFPLGTHPVIAVLTAVWAAVLIPLARRKPEIAMVATAPLFATTNFWAITTTTVAIFIAARLITPRRRLWLTVLVTGVAQTAGALLAPTPAPVSALELTLSTVFGLLFLLLFPAIAGMVLGRRKPLVRLLRERNEYLERAQALTAAKARTEERTHIAGEMHDMLGHRLSLISIHAGALELATASSAPKLQEQAELVRTTAAIAMAELREILGVLRANPEPESLDENTGTRSDVTRLVEESVAAGITVRLDWTGDDVLDADPRSRRAIHRVVREALTNVHKHASAARTRVTVTVQSSRAEVVVVNSPTEAPRGHGTRRGLIGLEERVGLIGGAFTAAPALEGGFRVAAGIPLLPAELPDNAAEIVTEAPAPIAAEVLTVPRVIGSGCLVTVVALPLVGLLVAILLFSTVGGIGLMSAENYATLQVGTQRAEVAALYGVGEDDAGCRRYEATDVDDGTYYRLCFRDDLLVSKEAIRP